MAWMDFIKRIRQDEEEEQRNPQGGVWGFLDDILDTGQRRAERIGKAFTPQDEEGYGLENRVQDIVGGLTPELIKDAAGIAAGAGREVLVKPAITAVNSVRETGENRARDAVFTTVDQLSSLSYEDRKKAIEGNEGLRIVLKNKGITDPTDENLAKAKTDVQAEDDASENTFSPTNTGLPEGISKALFGNEDVQTLQRRRSGLIQEAGWNPALATAGVGISAALDAPGPGKAVKVAAPVLKEIGSEGIERLVKSVDADDIASVLSGSKTIQRYGDDAVREASQKIATLTDQKAITKALDETFSRAKPLADDAARAASGTPTNLPASFPVDDATRSKVDELVSTVQTPVTPGTKRLYQGTEGGQPTNWFFDDPDQMAQYFANRSDDVTFRSVDVPESSVTAMPQRPGVFQIADDAAGATPSPTSMIDDYNARTVNQAAPAKPATSQAVEAVAETTPPREISEFATSVAQDYRRADDFANDVADSMYDMDKTLRGGQMIPDGEGGYRRMSEHTPFYRDFYARNKRAPSRTDYQTAVREQMERGNGDLVEQDMVDAYGLIKNREGEVASLDQAPAQQFMDIVKQPAETPRDLQGGPGRQKIRSFLQTAKEGPYTTPEAKAAIDEIQPEKYTVQSQDPVLNAARQRVEKDFDGAMRYVDDNDKWTDDKAATLMELASKAMNEGRIDDFVDLLKKIDEGGREAGRGIAILNAWKRLSPEGIVKMAQREVDDIGSQGRLKPTVERLKKEVENATKLKPKDVQRAIDDALKQTDEVGDEAAEKSVGEKVAKNIESYMSPQKKKKVDELVTELTKKIKQEMLPARDGAPKRTATDVLKDVYKRGDEAAEAWPEAKEILRERFADNPEVLEQLDTFFRTSLGSPAASRTLDAAIRETMQKNKVRIAEVIQKSWDEQITDITGIARRLTESGFSPEDSRIIAEEVGSRVKSQVDAAKLKQLQRFAKEAPKKVRPALEDKIAKFSNLGAMNDSDYYDLVRTKLDLPTLDNKTIEKISGLAQKMQALPDGPERSVVLGDILKSIADTMPVTGREKFNAYRYQNLLSSPRTQIRNVAANTFNMLITRPATLFTGAAGDTIASALGKKPRERFFKEIPAYYSGLARGYLEANKAMEAAWKGTADITNPDFADQFGKGAIQQARMRNLPKKWTVVSRLMEAQDRMFSGMIGGGEYNALIKRGVPEEEAVKRAHEMAEYSLLRQALDPKNATGQGAMLSAIDAASAAITDFANKVPMGRWMVPFVRTPLNFGKQWLEFSPVGLVNATAGDTLARRAGREVMTDERRIEALNKGMLGTALTGLGVTLAAEDKLTWSVPDNQRDRDLFYAQGKKPYSVKIGDKWIPMINFGPFGFALGLPASFKHNFAESPDSMNDNVAQKLYKSVASMGELLSQQTFLQGVNNLFSLISGDEDMNFEKFAAGLGGQVIPLNSLIRYAASITDPVYREAESFVDYIKRDIPGLSNDLPAQTNVATGEPTVRNWSDYVAPYSIGTENSNPDKQGNVDAVAEFYQSLARGNNQRTKTNEKITEALLANDNQEANRLALEHNGRVLSETKRFIDSHRDELQRNPAILERMAEELDSALIMLNNRSINQRVRSQTEKQELSDILSR